VDGSPRSRTAHQDSVRRRLLYVHEEMKTYCDRPIVTKDTSTKGIAKTKRISFRHIELQRADCKKFKKSIQ